MRAQNKRNENQRQNLHAFISQIKMLHLLHFQLFTPRYGYYKEVIQILCRLCIKSISIRARVLSPLQYSKALTKTRNMQINLGNNKEQEKRR